MAEKKTHPPVALGRARLRWRMSPSWVGVLVAVVLVAVVAAALTPFNGNYYEVAIYNDPQTSEERYEQVMVDVFMAHTSGFFWGQFIALLLGAFLASRLRGMRWALAAALSVGVLLAAVNFAAAWHSSSDIRRWLAWRAEKSAGLPIDLLSDDRFHHVLAAGLAAFPIAAIAGVGLGTLIAPLLRLPAVAVASIALLSTVSYGAFAAILGWLVAIADSEPVALFVVLALLPPTAVTPSVVRTAIGDHGGAFTVTMLTSGVAWALLLTIAGWIVEGRRTRSVR
ncbi:hypothetical protein ABTX15_20545 [Micromonospora sp. NPDC094482]|uniref:hypothetical protein n=1 Tax=unclassified Micromonospora TaxID=2617518 RepID=UPI003319E235